MTDEDTHRDNAIITHTPVPPSPSQQLLNDSAREFNLIPVSMQLYSYCTHGICKYVYVNRTSIAYFYCLASEEAAREHTSEEHAS